MEKVNSAPVAQPLIPSGIPITVERCPLCKENPELIWPVKVDTWVMCDVCEIWYHAACLDLPSEEVDRLDQFHCPTCVVEHGPSTYKTLPRKSTREHVILNYADLDNGLSGDERQWARILESKRFAADPFKRYHGSEITIDWIRERGMKEPFVFETPEKLGMTMPDRNITVRDVAAIVGPEVSVDVIDVASQSELVGWNLYKWAEYFHDPSRTKIRNVISLEISHTKLAEQIQRPKIVRDMDWIEHVWPADLKVVDYPKVQLYCLMSVKDSYTDFHIDFGGTSVFYHILSGAKTFFFIRPTPTNLRKYEKWSSSPNQSITFLGDEVKECYEVKLTAGNTMIIPTGWIHAVYTSADSVVIGGNFLHGYNIGGQLAVYEIEKRTNVPLKFRFPYYERMMWYAALKYVDQLHVDPASISKHELEGLADLAKFISAQAGKLDKTADITPEERKWVRSNIPATLKEKDASPLAAKLTDLVNKALAGDLQPTKIKLKLPLKPAKREDNPPEDSTTSPGNLKSTSSFNYSEEPQKPKIVLKLNQNKPNLQDMGPLGIEKAATSLSKDNFEFMDDSADEDFLEDTTLVNEDEIYADDGGEYVNSNLKKSKRKITGVTTKPNSALITKKKKTSIKKHEDSDESDDGLGLGTASIKKSKIGIAKGGVEKKKKGNVRDRIMKSLKRR